MLATVAIQAAITGANTVVGLNEGHRKSVNITSHALNLQPPQKL